MSEEERHELEPLAAVQIGPGGDSEEAERLGARLNIPVIGQESSRDENRMILLLDQDGLALQYQGQTLRGDFTGMKRRLRPANLQREMLVKAARIKGMDHPLVLDATAGMGEDSLLLAAAGFLVQMYERDPVIAALLRDTLKRASSIPEFAPAVSRMKLHEDDSIYAMNGLDSPPDVILLDPMFPEKQKSALTKKKFQLLHFLERPCQEEDDLLQAAISAAPRKIIIKRPLKGSFLSGKKPDYSLKGKTIRYDCMVFARNNDV